MKIFQSKNGVIVRKSDNGCMFVKPVRYPILIENADEGANGETEWVVSFTDHNPEEGSCMVFKTREEAEKLINLCNLMY